MNLDKLGFWGYVRLLLSLGGIVFVWTLPHNPVANDHGTSISEFIANPRATGMMAAFSFVPISLMWEYQDYYIKVIKSDEDNSVIVGSLTMYQIFYGAFLSCTVGLVPNYVHTLCVALFGVSFLIHAILVVKVLEPHNITKLQILKIGLLKLLCFALVGPSLLIIIPDPPAGGENAAATARLRSFACSIITISIIEFSLI